MLLLFSLDSFLNKVNHVMLPSSFLPTSFWWEPTFLTEKETSPGRCCQDDCVSIGGYGGTMATIDLSPLRFINCWSRWHQAAGEELQVTNILTTNVWKSLNLKHHTLCWGLAHLHWLIQGLFVHQINTTIQPFSKFVFFPQVPASLKKGMWRIRPQNGEILIPQFNSIILSKAPD